MALIDEIKIVKFDFLRKKYNIMIIIILLSGFVLSLWGLQQENNYFTVFGILLILGGYILHVFNPIANRIKREIYYRYENFNKLLDKKDWESYIAFFEEIFSYVRNIREKGIRIPLEMEINKQLRNNIFSESPRTNISSLVLFPVSKGIYTIQLYQELNYLGRALIGAANIIWALNRLEYNEYRNEVTINIEEGNERLTRNIIKDVFRFKNDNQEKIDLREKIQEVFEKIQKKSEKLNGGKKKMIYNLKDTMENRVNYFLWQSLINLLQLLWNSPIYLDKKKDRDIVNEWNKFLDSIGWLADAEKISKKLGELTEKIMEYCNIERC